MLVIVWWVYISSCPSGLNRLPFVAQLCYLGEKEPNHFCSKLEHLGGKLLNLNVRAPTLETKPTQIEPPEITVSSGSLTYACEDKNNIAGIV